MAALPYIQLYVADYLADTAHLMAAQHGAYLLLIMNYWQTGGPLKNCDERLMNITRTTKKEWERIRPVLEEFFTITQNEWIHKRIEQDLDKVRAKSDKARDAAKRRHHEEDKTYERSANVVRSHCYTDTDTDTDTDTEKEIPTNVGTKKVKRKHPLPDDFVAKESHVKSAAEKGLNLQHELEEFKTYWGAKGGAPYSDWDKAFHNWLLNALKFKTEKEKRFETSRYTNSPKRSFSSTFQQPRSKADRYFAACEGAFGTSSGLADEIIINPDVG